MPSINVWNKNQRRNKSARPCTPGTISTSDDDDDDKTAAARKTSFVLAPKAFETLLPGHAALFCYPTTQASTVSLP